jgi:hypothetical protein
MLVLTHLQDSSALRLTAQVRAGGAPCQIVTAEALSFARRRTHTVSSDGTYTVIELADGTVIEDAGMPGVLNRCWRPPDLAWQRAAPAERAYAGAELQAFMVSWLSSLTVPVRNRPVADSLVGPAPTPMVAAMAAAKAGLHVHRAVGIDSATNPPSHPPTATRVALGGRGVHRQVVLLDGTPFGADLDDATLAAVRAMVGQLDAHEAIVGLDFVVDRGTWWFVGMTPLPELPATPEFADAVVGVLDAAPAVTGAGGRV